MLGARTSPSALSAKREDIVEVERLAENDEGHPKISFALRAQCGRGRPRSQLQTAFMDSPRLGHGHPASAHAQVSLRSQSTAPVCVAKSETF